MMLFSYYEIITYGILVVGIFLLGVLVGLVKNPNFNNKEVVILKKLYSVTAYQWRRFNAEQLDEEDCYEIADKIISSNYAKCCEKYCKGERWEL